MADNITLDAGSGGAVMATDDISGVHYQLIKLGYGALDAFTIVTASAGLPVAQQGTWTVTGTGGTFPVTDSGGSLTVDAPVGTPVFVRLSDGSSPISTLPVSATSLPLPTGAATETKQPALGTAGTASADVITVQGIASMTALKVDGSGVSQPVTGTFWQATQPVSLASVPSHDVTNGGTFVVQINGAALTALQLIDDVVYAEDTAHSTGDKGIQILAVRRDTAASSTATDGEYATINTDSTGRLWCNVSNTVTVGTHDIGTVATVTSLTQFNGTTIATNSGSKDAGTLRVVLATDQPALTNKLLVTPDLPTDASTASKQPALGTAGTASADVITVQGITSMTPLLATLSGTNNIATVTTVTTVSAVTTLNQFNGTTIATNSGNKDAGTLRVVLATDQPALTNKLLVTPDANSAVNISQINGVTPLMGNGASGTGALRVSVANDSTGILAGVTTVTTVSTVTTLANGQTAHDSAVSGSPLRIGARAETALSGITLVADGDATDLYAGVDGVLITRPHCNLEDVVQERTTNTDGASTAFASGLAAPGAGVRLWIKNVTICNSSSSFCTVDLRDGSGGSVLWTLPVPAIGGVTHNFDPPLRLSANTALAFDASAATTTLSISANGFKSKV